MTSSKVPILRFEPLVGRIRERAASRSPCLVGVDGRPCAGKTTLATRLSDTLGCSELDLDDFVVPFRQQPANLRPAFPFPYVRYDGFLAAIRSLAAGSDASFLPYDWSTDSLAVTPKVIPARGIVLVIGVSALNEETRARLDLGVYVVSAQASREQAIFERDGGQFADKWRSLWLPSDAIYQATRPWSRADVLYPGRGIEHGSQVDRELS